MKSIKQKVLVVLLSVTVAFTLLTGFSMYILNSITDSYNEVIDQQGKARNNVQVVVSESVKQSLAVRGLIVSTKLENEKQFNTSKEEIDKRLNETLTLISTSSDQQTLQKLLALNMSFKEQFDKMNTVAKNGGTSEELMNIWQNDVYAVGQEMMKTAQTFSTQLDEKMTETSAANKASAHRAFTFMAIISAILIVIVVLVSLKFNTLKKAEILYRVELPPNC
ncbi:hypothetical protein [Kurthia massiliensis]|uniref:hypothetical protein n=1 Tax=Kurthia massiliensis TaxID=1033739 RepID=UPI0002886E0E|nr:hypothetical protein [Kurthia massiliensis]